MQFKVTFRKSENNGRNWVTDTTVINEVNSVLARETANRYKRDTESFFSNMRVQIVSVMPLGRVEGAGRIAEQKARRLGNDILRAKRRLF